MLNNRFNVGESVFVFNKEKHIYEIGIVQRRYKRQKVWRYDVLLERGHLLQFLCTNSRNIFYIDEEKTRKFFNQININEVRKPN